MKNWIGQSTIPIFKCWTGPDVMPLESGGNLKNIHVLEWGCLKVWSFNLKKKLI